MKSFHKLALASAVALTSVGAFAMQSMDDESMSAATGQEGITMQIALPCYNAASGCSIVAEHGLSIDQVFVKDVDGFTANDSTGASKVYANTGFILIDGIKLTTTSGQPITVKVDQTGNSGNVTGTAAAAAGTDTPTLNVNVRVPAITVAMGATYVTNSSDSSAVGTYVRTKIANAMTVSTSGATTLNIQLGAQPQGALVTVSTAIASGLSLGNVGVHDGVLNGDINTGTVTLIDGSSTGADGTALTVVAAVNVADHNFVIPGSGGLTLQTSGVAPTGALVLSLARLGAAGTGVNGSPLVGGHGGINVTLANTTLGDASGAANLGDVIIKGLNINGTQVLVFGH